MKKLLIPGLLVVGFFSCLNFVLQAGPDAGFVDVDAKKTALLLKDNPAVVVLDIRTAQEFKTGYISGAKNIDFTASDFSRKLEALDKSKTYLVHCRSGRRSSKSLQTFHKLNFQSIYHLKGGINDWVKIGYPLQKP